MAVDILETYQLIVEEGAGKRLDAYLAGELQEFSRSFLQRLIDENHVTINNKNEKAKYKVCVGDVIDVSIPVPRELAIEPQNIPLEIVYEDDDLIVVNKPQGMVVHPAPGNYDGTLVNALLYHCKGKLSGINGVIRPGIVHRIDKDTSGVLVVAKNDQAHVNLAEQIKEHTVNRRYHTIVHHNIAEDEKTINAPIGRHPKDRKKMAVTQKNNKHAVTHIRVIERLGKYTWVEAKLETGRTHQIRVHMAYIGHPVVGDPVYGVKKEKFHLQGQALHAKVLGFNHPRTGEYMEFEAPLPQYFIDLLDKIRGV